MNTHTAVHRNGASSELKHMGMHVEGIRPRGIDGRLLITRNVATGRRWIVDPATGIGEPAPDEPVAPPLVVPTAPSAPKAARRSSGGPFVCEHCSRRHLFVLRFPDGTVMSKCLSCRRFVVDGNVERDAQRSSKRAALRQARIWQKRKRPRPALSLPLGGEPAPGKSLEPQAGEVQCGHAARADLS